MSVSDLSQLVRNTGRFREVVTVLAKYGFAGWLHDIDAEWVRAIVRAPQFRELGALSHEARIRAAMTELGTTFIKLGQILSTRPDLMGPELASELAELRMRTPPDPPDTVRATIEQEFGAPVDKLYREFDEQALASASIGQVHKAKLNDGQSVVVKVQHPGIEDRIRNDLEILHQLAQLAEKYSSDLRQYCPVQTTAEFSRALRKELDFRSEQRNLERFRRNFIDDPGVYFPATYPRLSTRRVLTMDMLDGINLSDGTALSCANFDLEDLARRGANLFVEMIFRDGFYHADPHPGNLMVLSEPHATGQRLTATEVSNAEPGAELHPPAAVIGVLDCGMVGRLDEPLREDIETALLAVVNGDSEILVEIIIRRGSTPADLNRDSLQADVEEFLDEYTQQDLDEFDLSGCLIEVVEIIRRHHILLPSKIAMLLKVLIMLEGTAQQLSPTFNLAEIIEPYGRKSFREKYSLQRLWKRLESRSRDWDKLIEILPRDAADILHRLKKGSFDVHLNHRRLDTTINRLVLGILAAALFMGSSLLLSQNVRPLVGGISLPGAVGCGVAVWLGFTLIRAIKQMGDIRRK